MSLDGALAKASQPRLSRVTQPPLVSVVLCTYNGEGHLCQQLDSLLAQDYPNLEIVAVDDASSDGSLKLLRDYAQQHPGIRIHANSSNQGASRNFEMAARHSSGELIAFCDQDDVWQPQKISRLLAHLKPQQQAVYCDSELIDEAGRPLGRRISTYLRMYDGAEPATFVFDNCVSGHALLMRRTAVEAALPFPELRFHDWWLAFVATSLGGIGYLPEPLVQYRQHARSVTDIAQRKAKAKSASTRVGRYLEKRQWLARLASLPSPHQHYFMALHLAWCRRSSRLLVVEIWRLLGQRREALSSIQRRQRRGWIWILRQSLGVRLSPSGSHPVDR